MKKTMRTLICLLMVIVVVAGLAAPASALSSTTKTTTRSGDFTERDLVKGYTCTVSASLTKATSSISYEGLLSVSCTVTATWEDSYGGPHTLEAYDSGTNFATATISRPGFEFVSARGVFVIGTVAVKDFTVT